MTVFTPAASSVAEDSLQLPGAAIQTHEGEPESSWGSEMSGSQINQTYRGARIRKLASHMADGGVPIGLAADHVLGEVAVVHACGIAGVQVH